MRKPSLLRRLGLAAGALILSTCFAIPAARVQENQVADPAAALSDALSAACRADLAQFAGYFTADNAAAFRALPEDQKAALMKRFALSDQPGKPLISSDAQNHMVLRCEAPQFTVTFRFGSPRTRENLTFIPVTVVDGEQTEFGMVREAGGWRLLSLGLVLLDIPQLSQQWAEQDLAAREDAAVDTLRGLAEAIESYRRAFGKLPDSLAQLGPAPKPVSSADGEQISPDRASLVNEHLADGSQGGYHFRYRIVSAPDANDTAFELAAAPDNYGKTGRRSFFLDSAGKVHGADHHGAIATADDPPLPGEKSP